MPQAPATPRTPPSASPHPYRFEHPGIQDVLRDMVIQEGEPGPRDVLGDFHLPLTTGGALTSASLAAQRKPLLLIFGSRSCPVMVSGVDGLKQLHTRYGAHVHFVMVQVREAHPGERIPQPHTFEQKMQHAIELKRVCRLPFDVAVDSIDGALHQTLGGRPNSAYLLSPSGTILFRAQWANETAAIDEALAAVTSGCAPPVLTATRTLPAILKSVGYTTPVLNDAGRGARADFWKMALPVALMAAMADRLRFLPREKRGLPALLIWLLLTLTAAALILAAM